MQIKKIADIPGDIFPAGRHTRVIIGPQCDLKANHFVMGQVTIFPNGSVPTHEHPEEEVYTILAGEGMMTVGEETRPVSAGTSIYIPSGRPHSLVNQGTTDMQMMFVYAPANIVAHWDEERQGKLK